MRRSTLVLWVGMSFTAAVLCLWGLSAWGSGYVSWMPTGVAGQRNRELEVSIDRGCLMFHRTPTYILIPVSDPFDFRVSFQPYAEDPFLSRENLPTWGETALGRFEYGNDDFTDAKRLIIPLWTVVVPVLGGTLVAFPILRRREERMMGAHFLTEEGEEEAAS